MCYKDDASTVIRTVCTDRAHDQRLDCNHDDYYHTNPSAGSYLSQFYNVADNLFLIRGGQGSPSPSPSVTPIERRRAFRLINGASSTCLDVPNSNTTDGTQLIIWSCNNGANQSFTQNGQTAARARQVRHGLQLRHRQRHPRRAVDVQQRRQPELDAATGRLHLRYPKWTLSPARPVGRPPTVP